MPRKKSNIHYIYKTTCLVTGRYYIGMHSTCNLDDGYMGSGLRLRRSIRKYSIEKHIKEILEYLPTRELLAEREKEIVTFELIKEDLCMNLKEGGNGGFTIEQQKLNSQKAVAKLKILRETNPEWFKKYKENSSISHKKVFEEGRQNRDWGKNWTGLKHSVESKLLMCKTSKGMGTGETNSQYGTCWITKDNINKKIKKEELETYQQEGWIKGRKK